MLVAAGPLVTMATPGAAGGVRVALGHVAGALLVAHEDVADRRVDERVVDGEDRTAGEAEHDLRVLHLEALDECLGSGELHGRAAFSWMGLVEWCGKGAGRPMSRGKLGRKKPPPERRRSARARRRRALRDYENGVGVVVHGPTTMPEPTAERKSFPGEKVAGRPGRSNVRFRQRRCVGGHRLGHHHRRRPPSDRPATPRMPDPP